MERKTIEQNTEQKRDYAVLVGLRSPVLGADSADEESLAELGALVETAGGEPVGTILQSREKPDPHSFIGEGKVEEVKRMVDNGDATMVIFDNDLSPSQIRVLTELCGVQVLDRSGLILDIFAQRAKTKEGCLQVELAQYQYLLPRLIGMWSHLERQGGTGGSPIGTKGPGETQLETDRRHIRRKIDKLKEELEEVRRVRGTQRQRRMKNEIPVVAIVGYTNAGKSTLLNALSGADVLVEDKLFATLDPVMRNVDLPENRSCLLVDTVGFIRKLPHQLVEAFHSTLEEALYADLLVVVSDVSNPQYREQRDTVFRVLNDLGAGNKPVLEALNKADRAKIGDQVEPADAILISAKEGRGLDRLKEEISKRIAAMRHAVEIVVPYNKGNVLSLIHAKGQVTGEEYLAEGTKVSCLLDSANYQRVLRMLKD